MIFGTGFAPFRGGLLSYADSEGLKRIVDTLADFSDKFDARFKPAGHLVKLSENPGRFYV